MNRAETLVSRYIHGDIVGPSVARIETVVLDKAWRVLPLEHSPITSVESVTVDGSPFSAFTHSIFCLRTKFDTCWPAAVNIIVTYKTGWEAGNYPDDIREAVAMVETWLASKPETGLTTATIGPFSATRNDSGFELPLAVSTLLQPWVRPLW